MPAWLLPLLLAGSAGASAAGGIADRRAQRDMNRENLEHSKEVEQIRDKRERDLSLLDVAQSESQGNPFSHILSQIAAASMLDRLAREKPKTIQPGSETRYTKYIPQGGYEASDRMRNAADALMTQVLSGRAVNTSAADPNAPRFGTLDLLHLIGQGDAELSEHVGDVGGARPSTPPWGTTGAIPRPNAPSGVLGRLLGSEATDMLNRRQSPLPPQDPMAMTVPPAGQEPLGTMPVGAGVRLEGTEQAPSAVAPMDPRRRRRASRRRPGAPLMKDPMGMSFAV